METTGVRGEPGNRISEGFGGKFVFKSKVNSITADFRINAEDGVKSLLQLMNEQNPQVIPKKRKLKSLYFIVSAEGSPLILTSPAHTPGEFQMVVGVGDDKLFPLSPIPFFAEEALDFSFAATKGVCDFFVHVELV